MKFSFGPNYSSEDAKILPDYIHSLVDLKVDISTQHAKLKAETISEKLKEITGKSVKIQVNEKVEVTESVHIAKVFHWLAHRGIDILMHEKFGLVRALQSDEAKKNFCEKVDKIVLNVRIGDKNFFVEVFDFLLPSTRSDHFKAELKKDENGGTLHLTFGEKFDFMMHMLFGKLFVKFLM